MHPSLIILHSACDDPSGGRYHAQTPQLDTPPHLLSDECILCNFTLRYAPSTQFVQSDQLAPSAQDRKIEEDGERSAEAVRTRWCITMTPEEDGEEEGEEKKKKKKTKKSLSTTYMYTNISRTKQLH